MIIHSWKSVTIIMKRTIFMRNEYHLLYLNLLFITMLVKCGTRLVIF